MDAIGGSRRQTSDVRGDYVSGNIGVCRKADGIQALARDVAAACAVQGYRSEPAVERLARAADHVSRLRSSATSSQ